MTTTYKLLLAATALSLAACGGSKSSTKGDANQGEGETLTENIHQKTSNGEKVTEFDLNGDKKPDVWTYTVPGKSADGRDIDKLVRKELDLNWDGKVDVARWYDDKEQIEKEALDLDFDGTIDQVNYYEKGQLVRKERDTNGDGKVDYWEYWENGQVDRVGEDLDGDGQVDKWTKNPNSEG